MKGFIEVSLVDSYFGYFKQCITCQLLICDASDRRDFDDFLPFYFWRRYSAQVISSILDNLFKVKYGFIFMVLLFEDLTLVVVGLCILIIFVEQLFKVDETLFEVFQLVKEDSPLVHALVATPWIHWNRLVVRLQSSFEVTNSFHRVCLTDVARAIIGLKIDHMLEVYQCFFKFLEVNMNLPTGLVCFYILGKLLNSSSQLQN